MADEQHRDRRVDTVKLCEWLSAQTSPITIRQLEDVLPQLVYDDDYTRVLSEESDE